MLVSFAAVAVTVTVAALPLLAATQSICDTDPLAGLICLKAVREAAEICSELPVETVTTTRSTTILDMVTVSTTQQATSQETVDITSTETVYTAAIEGPTKTITQTAVLSTSTVQTTQTTYLPPSALAQARAVENCQPSTALDALKAITADDRRSTACSCIGHAASTSTSTEVVTAPSVPTTTSIVVGVALTTTIYHLAKQAVTTTAPPVAYTSISTVNTESRTTTASLAAPTFARVFGPQAGCAYTHDGIRTPLGPETTCADEATKQCQAMCEQEPTCRFVWVQKLACDAATRAPRFQCQMTDAPLHRLRDIRCGKGNLALGEAHGYNADGRGVA